MTVNYNDGKWHGWNGGGCPVHPLSEVEAVWHDENRRTSGIRCGAAHGGAWFNQILKFRVIKEHREPREFWIDPEYKIITAIYHAGFIHVREVLA